VNTGALEKSRQRRVPMGILQTYMSSDLCQTDGQVVFSARHSRLARPQNVCTLFSDLSPLDQIPREWDGGVEKVGQALPSHSLRFKASSAELGR
jgi:hypothetical protein